MVYSLSCPDENPERLKVLDISNFFTLQTVENCINLEENKVNNEALQNEQHGTVCTVWNYSKNLKLNVAIPL